MTQESTLTEILELLKERLPASAGSTRPVMDARSEITAKRIQEQAYRKVFQILDGALVDQIETAKKNHDALEHRNEPIGKECWRRFGVSDIENMIKDAARELGIEP